MLNPAPAALRPAAATVPTAEVSLLPAELPGELELVLVSTGMVSIPPVNGGAVEAYVADLARIFSRRPGVHVSVISNHRNPGTAAVDADTRWIPTHSPIDSFPLRPAPSALAHLVGGSISALVTRRHIARIPASQKVVVHLNEEISAMAFAPLGRRVGRVFTIHNPPPSTGDRGYGGFEYAIRHANARATWRFALRRMDAVIALTPWIRRFLVEEWALDGSKVHVLPLPVDIEMFRPPEVAVELSPSGPPPWKLLFVGRLEPRKNVLTAVDALPYLPPETQLTVVGDGPLASATIQRARQLGVQRRVSVVQRLPMEGLVNLYRSSTALVHPSLLEAYPRVVVEAAACGLPTVLPESPMYSEFLLGGAASSYDPLHGPKGLAGAVTELLADPRRRGAARSSARSFALRNNSYTAFAEGLARVYASAVP